MCFQ